MNLHRLVFALGALAVGCLDPQVASAQFTLVETGGTFRTDATNLAAAANGASAIGQDELGLGVHFIANINDGTYGNSSSWIGDDRWEYNPDTDQTVIATTPYSYSSVGVSFSTPVTIGSIALGRDNLGGFTDRVPASYLIEINRPSMGGWSVLGSIDPSVSPSPAVRNLYNLSTPVSDVTSLLITVRTGIEFGAAIDELEVYATAATAIPEPSTYAALAGLGALGLAAWRRRQRAA